MQPYEYVLVLASIVVGLAIADLLVSLQRMLRARHRIRWDWAMPATALVVLMTIVQIWWALYDPPVKPVTIGGFIPVLVELVLLFLLAAAALPDEVPEAGLALKDYYESNRRYVWTMFSLALGWVIVTDIAGDLIRHADPVVEIVNHAADILVVAAMTSMIFVQARWWHAIVLALLCISGPLAWLSRSLQ